MKDEKIIQDPDQFEDIGQSAWGFTWSNITGGSTLSATLAATGSGITFQLRNNSIAVLNASNVVQTGWTFNYNQTNQHRSTSISATPPSGYTPGQYKFRLIRRQTDEYDSGSFSDSVPPVNVDSNSAQVGMVTAVVATAAWSAVSYCSTSNKLQGTMTFNNGVTGISTSDFEVINASGTTQSGWTFDSVSSTAAANTGFVVRATAPNNTNATFRLRLKATSVRGGTASTDNSPASAVTTSGVAIDNRPQPKVASATWSNASYTGGKLQATLTFNLNVSGIEATDFRVVQDQQQQPGVVVIQSDWAFDAPPATATGGTGIVIRATPPPNTNGQFRLFLQSTTVRGPNAQSNNSPASNATSANVSVDNRPQPEVATATWSNLSLTSGKFQGTLTFNKNVTGITASDFQITDGDNNLIATGWTFDTPSATASANSGITIRVTPPANTNGNYKLVLKPTSVRGPNALSDNSPATVARSASYLVDNRSQITVATAAWSAESYTNSKLQATLTFSGSNVSGIATSDFEVVNDANPAAVQSGWTFDSVSATANAGTGITIRATPPSNTNGNFAFRLKATSVRSTGASSDNSPAAAVTSGEVSIDNRPSAIVATASWSNVAYSNGRLDGTITFNQAVTGINAADFNVLGSDDSIQTGWTIGVGSSSAAANTGVLISITPPANTNGNYKIRLRQSSVLGPSATTANSPSSNIDTALVAVDNRPAIIVATAAWSGAVASGGALQAYLTFSGADITGITSDDFEVLNDSNTVQSGWDINIPSSTAQDGIRMLIRATPPSSTNASFMLRLKATSVRSGGSNIDNAPASAVTTSAVAVDNTATNQPVVAEYIPISARFTRGRLHAAFHTELPVSHAIPNAHEVLDENDVVQTGWTEVGVDIGHFQGIIGGYYQDDVTFVPPNNINGRFKVRLKANSVRGPFATTANSPALPVVSELVAVDTRPVIAVPTWGTPSFYAGKIQTTLTFNETVTDLETSDFEVLDNNDTLQVGWGIEIIGTPTANTSILIRAVPANQFRTRGQFKIRLKQNTCKGPYALTDNTPSTNIDSLLVMVDDFNANLGETARPATATWSNVAFDTDTSILSATLTFNKDISGLSSADLFIIDNLGRIGTGWIFEEPPVFASADTGITIRVQAPPGINTTVGLRLRSRSVTDIYHRDPNSPLRNSDSPQLEIDTRNIVTVPLIHFTAPTFTGGKLQARMRVTGSGLSGVGPEDFDVIDDTGIVQRGWIVNIPYTQVHGSRQYQHHFLSDRSVSFITAIPPDNTAGSFGFRLRANTSRSSSSYVNNNPPFDLYTLTTFIDNRGSPYLGFPRWTRIIADDIGGIWHIQGEVLFEAPVTGFDGSDFEVIDNSVPPVVQTGWTVPTFLNQSVAANDSRTIAAFPPANTNGIFSIQLKRQSMMSRGSTDNNIPVFNQRSPAVSLNNRDDRPVISTGSWGNPSFVNGKLEFPLTFTHDVTHIDAADFHIENETGDIQSTNWTFDVPPTTAQAGIPIIIRATPNSFVTHGLYAFVLNDRVVRGPNAQVDNSPQITTRSIFFPFDRNATIANASWGPATYSRGRLEATLTFDQDITRLSSEDIEIISTDVPDVRGWAFGAITGPYNANTGISIYAIPPVNTRGSYAFRLKERSVLGPNAVFDNSPLQIVTTNFVDVNNIDFYTAAWDDIMPVPDNNRTVSLDLFLSENPGPSLDLSDVRVEQMVGSNWVIDPNWVLATGSIGNVVQWIAIPKAVVTAGTYRLVLNENAFGNNKPDSDIISNSFTIGDFTGVDAEFLNVRYANDRIDADLIFIGTDVTGIEGADFEVRDEAGKVLDGWTVLAIRDTTPDGVSIPVSVQSHPYDYTFNARLVLKKNSVNYADGTGPPEDLISEPIFIHGHDGIYFTNTRTSSQRKALYSTLVFSEDPGIISADDIIVEQWLWDTQQWTPTRTAVRMEGTGKVRYIKAYRLLYDGLYRFIFRPGSITTGPLADNRSVRSEPGLSELEITFGRPEFIDIEYKDGLMTGVLDISRYSYLDDLGEDVRGTDFSIYDDTGFITNNITVNTPQIDDHVLGYKLIARPTGNTVGNYRFRINNDKYSSTSYTGPGAYAQSSGVSSYPVYINNIIGEQESSFEFLKATEAVIKPLPSSTGFVYLGYENNQIYMFDRNKILVYNEDGTEATGTPIQIGDDVFTGFEVLGNNFYIIRSITSQISAVIPDLPDVARFQSDQRFNFIRSFNYGSIQTYNNFGFKSSEFNLKSDSTPGTVNPSSSTPTGIEGRPPIVDPGGYGFDQPIIAGQKFPYGITWVPSLQNFVTAGMGYRVYSARELFVLVSEHFGRYGAVPIFRYPVFYTYSPDAKLINEVRMQNVTNHVLDLAAFDNGVAVLEAGTTKIKVFVNNLRYSESQSFFLHDDNSNPLAITWNGAAFIVYDSNGKFYFYGDPVTEDIIRRERVHQPTKQYRSSFYEYERTYDLYRRQGSNFRVIKTNISAIVQPIRTRFDFTSNIPIRDQQLYVDMRPRFTDTAFRIGDILLPHSESVQDGQIIGVLPTQNNLEIESIKEVADKSQTLLCRESLN